MIALLEHGLLVWAANVYIKSGSITKKKIYIYIDIHSSKRYVFKDKRNRLTFPLQRGTFCSLTSGVVDPSTMIIGGEPP